MTKPILSLENVSKFYTSGTNVVVGLNSVSLCFHRGEFVAITGESGSGKSTLAHIAGGILPYESGELAFNGRPTSHFDGRDWEHYRRDNISFISQNYGILLSCTVLENVVSALRLSGMEKKAARQEARVILQKVELWDLRSRRAAKLSSGQKQRLSIARALAKPAPILIADEPTGNLDPENSQKVMQLLSQAAKDRLVLLITHDFQEAADYATRHISLLDGRVVMDAGLKPAAPCENTPPAQKPKQKQPLSLYAARLQLAGRPIWGSAVLGLLALTAFAVFVFLGTFIMSLDDTGIHVYDNSAFPNGDPTRIVVQRSDGAPLTEEDYATLLDIPFVSRLERGSYLADVNCYYIKDVHYRSSFAMVNIGTVMDPVYTQRESVEFLKYTEFAQTVPLMASGSFLTAGREPENIREVVLAGDEARIGETFTLYLQDRKHWSSSYYIPIEVEVVGVTDIGEGVYLHSDAGRLFCQYEENDFLYMPDASLEGDNLCLPLSVTVINGQSSSILIGKTIEYGGLEGILSGFHLVACPPMIQVSQEKFDETYANTGFGPQASLFILNYAYTGRVIQAAQKEGYIAVSPYQLGSTVQISSRANERMQTLLICAAVLLAVLVLQLLVLRALFGSETENYRLLANIGLTCSTAQLSVLWQILLFTAAGQAAGFAGLWYCNQAGVERIVSIIRYLPPYLMALLSAVHLAAALVGAWWICRTVRKRVYPMFVRSDDLTLDEEAEV